MLFKKKIQYMFPLYNLIREKLRFKKRIHGKNNSFELKCIFLSYSHVEIIGHNNTIRISKGTKLNGLKVYILGSNNTIEIGENCRINHTELWIEDNYCTITIGDKTTIESAHIAATENNSVITLGEDCMLAKQVVIRTGDSHSVIDITTEKRLNFAENVIIGNHVWIAERVTILKGVTIKDNSIIGTGSLVLTGCSQNSLIAGSPAKTIRNNITWERERRNE